MRFIIVLLLLTLNAKAQEEETISWDVNFSIENLSAKSIYTEYFTLMSTRLRAKTKYYLKGNMLVNISNYDSLNHTRSVHTNGDNFAYVFYTLNGVIKHKKQYFESLVANNSRPFTNDKLNALKFLEKKQVGKFMCEKHEIYIPEKNIRVITLSTKEIKMTNEFMNSLAILGLYDIGFLLGLEIHVDNIILSMNPTNFAKSNIEPSIFSASTVGIKEMDYQAEKELTDLVFGSEFSRKHYKKGNTTGKGINSDIYFEMCWAKDIQFCSFVEDEKKPSYDKTVLMSYLKTTNNKYMPLTKKEIDQLYLQYKLITPEELNAFSEVLDKIDKSLNGSTYRDLVQFLYQKKLMGKKEYRANLIQNLNRNRFTPKNKSHFEAYEFINGNIEWKTFLCSYEGIHECSFKNIVANKVEFLLEIKTFINRILPEFTVTTNAQNDFLELTNGDLKISYPVETINYIVEDSIISSVKKYDFETFRKNGLLKLLRQIGADYDLDLIFDFINSKSLLSHYQNDDKYSQINLFDGELFLCIDKYMSSYSFGKVIPFTTTDYDPERDELSGIKSFYASNTNKEYIPLYKKEKLHHLINKKWSSFGIDSSFDINIWFNGIKNQQYENTGSLLQSIPNLGVVVSKSLLNGLSYNKYGSTYQNIFPRLHQLFGQDFQPQDVVLTCGELNAELTFKFFEKTYTIKSDIFKIEEAFLKKAINLLKENNLYKTRKVYQSIEDLTDVNTKKLFYLTKENHKILSEEFELPLVEFPY